MEAIDIKIALSRYKNTGYLGSDKYVELPNGFGSNQFVTKFDFSFAYLNQSISDQVDNLGSNQNNTKLIASLDPRFETLVNGVNGDQISINGTNYKITNVTKDDSDNVMPCYRITISLKSGFGNNSGGY